MANDRMRALQVNDTEIVTPCVGDKAFRSSAADDATLEVDSTTGVMQIKSTGTGLQNGVARAKMSAKAGHYIGGTLATASGAGGIFSEENTYGRDLLAEVIIHVTTGPTTAFTLDVGTDATGGSSSDDLIDGVSITQTTAGDDAVYSSAMDGGTNGRQFRVWKDGEFIVGTDQTPGAGGLVGNYLIYVIEP